MNDQIAVNRRDRRLSRAGQSTAEYAIIITLTAILVIIMLALLGISLTDVYCRVVGLFGSTPPQCASNVLWNEPFDNLDDWSMLQGNGWELIDGQLCNTEGGEHRAMTGDDSWSDYTVDVQQAAQTQGDGYGVYFRVSNEPNINGYVFQYDPGYRGGSYPNGAFLFRKVNNGGETGPLSVAAAPLDFQWNDVTRQVTVDVRGDTFTASIDGEEVLQARDSQYTTGRVGIRAWDGTRACFDNLSVTQ